MVQGWEPRAIDGRTQIVAVDDAELRSRGIIVQE
jgi:hypothetical protein